jgi:hypothetical protein
VLDSVVKLLSRYMDSGVRTKRSRGSPRYTPSSHTVVVCVWPVALLCFRFIVSERLRDCDICSDE